MLNNIILWFTIDYCESYITHRRTAKCNLKNIKYKSPEKSMFQLKIKISFD